MKNAIKITYAGLAIATFALPALCNEKNIAGALENAIDRAVTHQVTTSSPLEAFTWKISQIPQPEAAPLMEALEILTEYNVVFETEKDVQVLRTLAAKLEKPVPVAWNTYRGNGLKEIFDEYIPNSHGNKQIAKLEYYVKFYTLAEQTHNRTHLISKILSHDFMQAYGKLKNTITSQSQRNDKELIAAFARFAPYYDALAKQDSIVAKELKYSLFAMPIQTGWDRTFTIKELVSQLGINHYGDGYNFRSIEEIQSKTGASAADAEVFASFVRALR